MGIHTNEIYQVELIKSTTTNRLIMPTIEKFTSEKFTSEKFTSEKERVMLGFGGYIFKLEWKTDEKLIFRCHNRDCKGACYYRISIRFTLLI
jgi:hypothetical protein